jgi:hypothetical protein
MRPRRNQGERTGYWRIPNSDSVRDVPAHRAKRQALHPPGAAQRLLRTARSASYAASDDAGRPHGCRRLAADGVSVAFSSGFVARSQQMDALTRCKCVAKPRHGPSAVAKHVVSIRNANPPAIFVHVLEFNLHQWPSAAQRHPLRPLDDDNRRRRE